MKPSRFLISTCLALTFAYPDLRADELSLDARAKIALRSDPSQLDSTKATDLDSFFILGHVMEGLVRFGEGSKIVPGVAESFQHRGLKWTFKLRKNALYNDGTKVTANDFVFGWQTVVNPKTASGYAFFLYPIKNAEKISKGELQPTQLGVKAIDDLTLEVELEKPCGHFLNLLPYPAYFPVHEKFFTEHLSKYASSAGELLYNGPFMITKWDHGSKILMSKNLKYWNASHVNLDGVDVVAMTTDGGAKLNFFKEQKIDILSPIGRDELPLVQGLGKPIESFSDGGVWFLDFNMRDGHLTRDLRLRQAIAWAFSNRKEFMEKIVGIPGAKPAWGLVPPTWGGPKQLPSIPTPTWLDSFKKEWKSKSLTLLVSDSPLGKREAEYFQELFRKKLGLEIKIDNQVLKQKIAKMNAGDYDIASHNWSPDYPDAMAYLELRASWNRSNRAHWKNDTYDQALKEALETQDPRKRTAFYQKAQAVLAADVGILPTYQSTALWIKNPKLKGVVRRVFGPDPDFSGARF